MSKMLFFPRFASWMSKKLGHPLAFGIAVLIVLLWIISGPFFHFSNTWQLVINTGTTVITFLMVFLIQNSQNRESQSLQVKLDEVIRSLKGADNALLNSESLSEYDLEHLHEHYSLLAQRAKEQLQQGKEGTHKGEGNSPHQS